MAINEVYWKATFGVKADLACGCNVDGLCDECLDLYMQAVNAYRLALSIMLTIETTLMPLDSKAIRDFGEAWNEFVRVFNVWLLHLNPAEEMSDAD